LVCASIAAINPIISAAISTDVRRVPHTNIEKSDIRRFPAVVCFSSSFYWPWKGVGSKPMLCSSAAWEQEIYPGYH
jgi:hypothetical protein